jgi:hypothetical protein
VEFVWYGRGCWSLLQRSGCEERQPIGVDAELCASKGVSALSMAIGCKLELGSRRAGGSAYWDETCGTCGT